MSKQLIYDIAEILYQKGIENIVLSPGSRCAPLTISCVRHPHLKTYSIPDERSAAFIALGMAENSSRPVVLICTSGSASLNYYPAIAEAFYRHIPLVVITADRPSRLLDIWDGQTINQNNVYANHVEAFYTLPEAPYDEAVTKEFANLLNLGIEKSKKMGPVHFNLPLDEPLYPDKGEVIKFSTDFLFQDQTGALIPNETPKAEDIKPFKKVMILVGQQRKDEAFNKILFDLAQSNKAVVIADHIGNLYKKEAFVNTHDLILKSAELHKALQPDLLISFGQSILSKDLKRLLRNSKNLTHWQVSTSDGPKDTFFNLKKLWYSEVIPFLDAVNKNIEPNSEFSDPWRNSESEAQKTLSDYASEDIFTEFHALNRVLDGLPRGAKIHSANSLSTRYVNFLQSTLPADSESFCNRGTSGIDGSNSTAMGHALVDNNLQVLVTGDLAFFYDRNAFWHTYEKKNLRIILLNNHGGGIFRVIEGPAIQPELDGYFDSQQSLNALNTSRDFGFNYTNVQDFQGLELALKSFFDQNDSGKILEIETDKLKNEIVFKELTKRWLDRIMP